MCFILAAKKTPSAESDETIENAIREIMVDKMGSNGDGSFVLSKAGEIRTMDWRKAYDAIADADIGDVMSHFRMGTSGNKDETNIHGWKHGRFRFMHNGQVSDFSDYHYSKEQVKTDSLLYFEGLVRAIGNRTQPNKVAKAIDNYTADKGFWGRALLHDLEHDKLYMFGDFEVYVINDSYIVITSTKVSFDKLTTWKDVHGFTFEEERELNLHVMNQSVDGVGVIEGYSTDAFKYKNIITKMKEKTHSYYKGGSGNSGDSKSSENDDEDDNWAWFGKHSRHVRRAESAVSRGDEDYIIDDELDGYQDGHFIANGAQHMRNYSQAKDRISSGGGEYTDISEAPESLREILMSEIVDAGGCEYCGVFHGMEEENDGVPPCPFQDTEVGKPFLRRRRTESAYSAQGDY